MFWMGPVLLAASTFAAEPVFVPDFTPGSGDEFAVSVMLQSLVVEQLVEDGFVVLTNEVVGRVVGPEAIASCAARPGCPADVLPKVPSQLALVVSVSKVDDKLVGNVSFYESGGQHPVQVSNVPIVGGAEQSFALEVSRVTAELLDKLGASPDTVLLAAARMIAGQTPPAPVPVPAPSAVTEVPAPAVPTPAPVVAAAPAPVAPKPPVPAARGPAAAAEPLPPHEGDLGPVLEGTGITRRHLLGSEGSFRRSGMDPRDWIYQAMPHAGRLTFEVRSGIAMGDVDRLAKVRVETTGGEQTNSWFEEGPLPSRRVRGDLFVGYAAATMFDFGLLAGIQYGRRGLSTGVVLLDDTGAVVEEQVDDLAQIEAVSLYLQPRARVYLVPLGPAKPFLFTGFDFRIFDGYHIEQPPSLNYPSPPGGVVPGAVGGAGLMIDPGPIVGFFGEGSVTRHFGSLSGPRTYSTAGAWPHDDPSLEITQGITVAITGGVQFRL